MPALVTTQREPQIVAVAQGRRLPPSLATTLGAALRQALHQALAAPVLEAVARLPPEVRPGAAAVRARAAANPEVPALLTASRATPQDTFVGTAPHALAAPRGDAEGPAAAPSLALGRPQRQSLRSLLTLLAASGDPQATQFALDILQEEHQAVMGALKAWGESLREQAKLAKRADARRYTLLVAAKRTQERARQQVVARLRTCRQHIDRHLRSARPRRGVARVDRSLLAQANGLGRDFAGAVPPTYRAVVRPGLAPSPPSPMEGIGGFALRARRRVRL